MHVFTLFENESLVRICPSEVCVRQPVQDLFLTDPASQRPADDSGCNAPNVSCLMRNILGGQASCLFSCLLPVCWEVSRGGRPGLGLAKAAGSPAQRRQMPRDPNQRSGYLTGNGGPVQEGLRGAGVHLIDPPTCGLREALGSVSESRNSV